MYLFFFIHLYKLFEDRSSAHRVARFTHVNDTVSCFSNKCLQNWPTVYTNFSM